VRYRAAAIRRATAADSVAICATSARDESANNEDKQTVAHVHGAAAGNRRTGEKRGALRETEKQLLLIARMRRSNRLC
jgi:hypothetical protein